MDERRIGTQAVHAGEPRPGVDGAVVLPVFQSAMYLTPGQPRYEDIRYIRLNNTPNHRALTGKLAALEATEAALVTASGMAAITTTLLALLRPGDHLLVQRGLYGGTHSFVMHDLPALGIAVSEVDAGDPTAWAQAARPETRAFYVESISNPLLRLPAFEQVVAFCRERGLCSLIDSTFATPVNLRPAELGFDAVLHSATKYLNGHSDLVAGALCASSEIVERVVVKLAHLGGSLDPHACFLLSRGIKTLALRVRQQNATALHLARMLEAHPAVHRVHYPGLPSHPDHERAKSSLAGFGGVVSFELAGGQPAVDRLVERVELPLHAPSLGGVETLLTQPARTSHAGLSAEERAGLGIGDALVRVSVGIESAEDLEADFERALG